MLKAITPSIIALGLGLSMLLPDMASAQSRQDFREMEKNIEKLTKQLRAVQRQVFKGADGEVNVPAGDEAGVRQVLADMEARFGTLDRQVREMTGKFEELQHAQTRMEAQLALFRKDMDLRFQDMQAPSTPLADGAVGEGVSAKDTPVPSSDVVPNVEGAEITPLIEPETSTPVGDDATKDAPEIDPRRAYGEAFSFVRKGDFMAAEAALKAFLQDHGDHELAGNAQYWLGETYYARKDYARAAAAFLTGFQSYAQSAKGPDSLLKLGLSLFGMGKKEEACSALAELPVVYPKATDTMKKRAVRELERIGCN